MFEGFALQRVDVGEAVLRVRHGGSGPPVLLLHGHPRTSATATWWHWFFLGQTQQPAERVINADPGAWYRGDPEAMGAEAYSDFRAAVHDPAVVHAMCEDYRAGLGPDGAADDADRAAGRRIGCPTLVLWSRRDDLPELYGDVLEVWRAWADDVRGGEIDSGHHMAEEAPKQLARALRDFLLPLLAR